MRLPISKLVESAVGGLSTHLRNMLVSNRLMREGAAQPGTVASHLSSFGEAEARAARLLAMRGWGTRTVNGITIDYQTLVDGMLAEQGLTTPPGPALSAIDTATDAIVQRGTDPDTGEEVITGPLAEFVRTAAISSVDVVAADYVGASNDVVAAVTAFAAGLPSAQRSALENTVAVRPGMRLSFGDLTLDIPSNAALVTALEAQRDAIVDFGVTE